MRLSMTPNSFTQERIRWPSETNVHTGIHHTILAELKRRYRACRAGAKLKAWLPHNVRWKLQLSIPSVLMGNVSLLANRVDKVSALKKTEQSYRESSLCVLT